MSDMFVDISALNGDVQRFTQGADALAAAQFSYQTARESLPAIAELVTQLGRLDGLLSVLADVVRNDGNTMIALAESLIEMDSQLSGAIGEVVQGGTGNAR